VVWKKKEKVTVPLGEKVLAVPLLPGKKEHVWVVTTLWGKKRRREEPLAPKGLMCLEVD